MPPHSPTPWYRQIAIRIAYLWPLKAIGTMAFMALFFWAYFSVLHHPLSAATVMPLTVIDRWIPFSPAAFPAYVSLWVYASLPPALQGNFRALMGFGAWISALCLFCLAIFWLFPTAVPPAAIDWSRYPEMAVIKGVDMAGNAFPSLHVASAVFTAFWLARLFRAVGVPRLFGIMNWVVCLAIVWSTLATRQHVALDALAGLAVGSAFAFASLRHVRALAGEAGL